MAHVIRDLTPKLRKAINQLPHLPRALALVHQGAKVGLMDADAYQQYCAEEALKEGGH